MTDTATSRPGGKGGVGILHAVRSIAHAVLFPLLVLYPLLLALDDIESGFVRSVVNPHVFLLALIAAAMLARGSGERTVRISLRVRCIIGVVVALLVASWAWWTIGGGVLGLTIALIVALGVGACIVSLSDD